MNFAGKMMEGMMGGMSPEKIQEMMDMFFSSMSSEDRQNMMNGMMENFMGAMSQDEKLAMMQKMMEGMSGKNASPMMGMMGMMKNMMGGMMDSVEGNDMPWDMCRKMMGKIDKATDLAAYATPELRSLFEEWLEQINDEVIAFIKEEGKADPETLAAKFKISKESIHYILGKLAQSGRINMKVEI